MVYSCRDCGVDVRIGLGSIVHRFHVMDTEPFDCVLGTDLFAEHPQISSLFRTDDSKLTTEGYGNCTMLLRIPF